MSLHVSVPGVGVVEFPDSMSEGDIQDALQSNFGAAAPEPPPATAPVAQTWSPGPSPSSPETQPPEISQAEKNFQFESERKQRLQQTGEWDKLSDAAKWMYEPVAPNSSTFDRVVSLAKNIPGFAAEGERALVKGAKRLVGLDSGPSVKEILEGQGGSREPLIAKVPTSEISDSDSIPVTVGKEVYNLLAGVVNYAQSPEGTLAAATGGIGPIAARLVAGGFALDTLYGLGKQAIDAYENWGKMSRNSKIKAVVDMLGSGGFAALLGRGAIKGHAKPGEIPPPDDGSGGGGAGAPPPPVPPAGVTPPVAPLLNTRAVTGVRSVMPNGEVVPFWLPGKPINPEVEIEPGPIGVIPPLNEGVPNAIIEKARETVRQPEYPGVTPRPTVPANPPEVRQGPGESPGNSSGNVSGGNVPEVKAEAPPAPGESPKLTPADLQPALLLPNGSPVLGGKTHAEILQNRIKDVGDPEALMRAADDQSRHVFIDKYGNLYDRRQAAAALGETEPLQSERLNELKAKAGPPAAPESGTAPSESGTAPSESGTTPTETGTVPEKPGTVSPENVPPVSAEPTPPAQQFRNRNEIIAERDAAESNVKDAQSKLKYAQKGGTTKRAQAAIRVASEALIRAQETHQKLVNELAERDRAFPYASGASRGNARFENETKRVGPDILEWMRNTMKVMSRTTARKRGGDFWAQNKGDWDGAIDLNLPPHHKGAVYGEFAPDVVARAAFEAKRIGAWAGEMPDATPQSLWDAIRAASKARMGSKRGETRDARMLDRGEQELVRWEAATGERSKKNKTQVFPGELSKDETLVVDGETLRVTDVNADGDIVIKGGEKFGEQTFTEDSNPFWVEKWNKNKGEVDFGPAEDETPTTPTTPTQPSVSISPVELPKLRPGEKGTAELLQGEDAPFNLAGESAVDAERIAADKAKAENDAAEAAALEKKNQPDLFGEKPPVALETPKETPTPEQPIQAVETPKAQDPWAPGQKVRFGKNPQTWTILKETTDPRFPEERLFRVKNDRTGEEIDTDATVLQPVKARASVGGAADLKPKRDLDAELKKLVPGIDPSQFPNEASKRSAIKRYKARKGIDDEGKKGSLAENPPNDPTGRGPVELKSVEELRAALDRNETGLSAEAVKLIRAFLDTPMAKALDGVRFMIADTLEHGWQGSYFEGVVELARSGKALTAPHEFAHRLWEVLPEDLRQQFEGMRQKAIADRLGRSGNSFQIPILEDLRDNPIGGGEEFQSRGYAKGPGREIYHLASAEEFFTHALSKAFKEKVDGKGAALITRMKDFVREIVAVIRKALGLSLSQDQVLRNIMAGRYRITPESAIDVENRYRQQQGVAGDFNTDETAIANATARAAGAVGARAITPRWVEATAKPDETILDFGSGPEAAHTKRLRESGLNVTAHEFGGNIRDVHDPNALDKEYDTVFASNVLNVQSNEGMLRLTLSQISDSVKDGGRAVFNFPESPRKMPMDSEGLRNIIGEYFRSVERVGGTSKAPLFEAREPTRKGPKASLPDEESAGSEETKFRQVAGLKGFGPEYVPESIAKTVEAVRENVFNGTTVDVTPEITSAAWDLLGRMTRPESRDAFAGEVVDATGGKGAPSVLRNELWVYSLRMAARGDTRLFRSLWGNQAFIQTMDVRPGSDVVGDPAAALAMRYARERGSATLWESVKTYAKALYEVAGEQLGVGLDAFNRVVSAMDDLVSKIGVEELDKLVMADKLKAGKTIADVLEQNSPERKAAEQITFAVPENAFISFEGGPIKARATILETVYEWLKRDVGKNDEAPFVSSLREALVKLRLTEEQAQTIADATWFRKNTVESATRKRLWDTELRRLDNLAEKTAEAFIKTVDQAEWRKPESPNEVRAIIREALKSEAPLDPRNAVGFKADLLEKLKTAGLSEKSARALADAITSRRENDLLNSQMRILEQASKAKNVSSLIEDLRNAPYLAQKDPQWRMDIARRWFESNGLRKDQAIEAAKMFDKQFVDAMVRAAEKEVARLLERPSIGRINELISAIRLGLTDPNKPWEETIANRKNFKAITAEQQARVAEIDMKMSDASLSPPERAALQEQLYQVFRHVGWEKGNTLQAFAERFVSGLLSGVRTFTVQWAPVIQTLRDFPTQAFSDPKNSLNFANAIYQSWRNVFGAELRYAWQKKAYGFHLDEMELKHHELRRRWEAAQLEYDSTSNPGKKAAARLKQVYNVGHFVLHALNTMDQAMMATAREWKMVYYASMAFKDAGLGTEKVSQLMDSMALARQVAFEDARAAGLDPLSAKVRANWTVTQAVEDFVSNATGEMNMGHRILKAAEADIYSMVGRKTAGMKEQSEGMLSRPMNSIIESLANMRKDGATSILTTAVLGFVNIPFRTMRFYSAYSPYGLLRYGIYRYRTNRGLSNFWEQSFRNDLVARARFREALAGTAVMGLVTAWALHQNTADDDAGKESFSAYITGRGPENKLMRDAWTKKGWQPFSLNFVVNGRVVAVPLTRIGESLMFPFLIPASLDDAAWKKKAIVAAGNPAPNPLSNQVNTMVGTIFYMTGQRGILQGPSQWARLTEGGSGTPKIAAKLAATIGSSFVIPLKQLFAGFSDMFVGPLDQSSASSVIAAQFPIVGLPFQTKAVNRFADPLYDRSFYGIVARTGVPVAFQVTKNPENVELYEKLLLQKGVSAPDLRRFDVEEKYGPLSDEQFSKFSEISGKSLKSVVTANLQDLQALPSEGVKSFLETAARQSNAQAAATLNLAPIPSNRGSQSVSSGGGGGGSALSLPKPPPSEPKSSGSVSSGGSRGPAVGGGVASAGSGPPISPISSVRGIRAGGISRAMSRGMGVGRAVARPRRFTAGRLRPRSGRLRTSRGVRGVKRRHVSLKG